LTILVILAIILLYLEIAIYFSLQILMTKLLEKAIATSLKLPVKQRTAIANIKT